MNLQIVQSFFAHLPVDAIVIGVVFLVALVDAWRNGYARAASASLSFPIAAFLFALLPHTALLGSIASSLSAPVAQAALFAGVFSMVFLAVSRILGFAGGAPAPLLSALAAVAATAILVVVWEYIPAMQSIWRFGPGVEHIFGQAYALWWLAASYLALSFVMS